MKSAYNEIWLHNLQLAKETKQWCRQGLIDQQQFTTINDEYKSGFYHPNIIIRILLFIASLIALSGITGLLILLVADKSNETIISTLSLIYGVVSFTILEKIFISSNHHYKSGVTEALLYHSIGFTIGGVAGLTGFNERVVIVACFLVFSLAAIRYLDLISTAAALCALAYFVFFEMYNADGVARQLIPVTFIVLFTPLYFLFKKMKQYKKNDAWLNCLILSESLSLLIIYAAGNYFVVRELTVNMMGLEIRPGEDIPFALLFYFLTVIIPAGYLYAGIKFKDVILLRVSLVALSFSVFTFKYYYSTGHPEITLTAAGIILLAISIYLFRYLKTPKNGFTRENILTEKWANTHAEAFIISQTLGGNQVSNDETFKLGGGAFGGGGARGEF